MDRELSLDGAGTALVTPFHEDGSLDLDALISLVDWQIQSGIHMLVACGSTGEAATLTGSETVDVVGTVVRTAAGRVPVFAGCTHNSTAEAVRRARELASITGVTGILTANPYYSKPSQRGQLLHFQAIARAIAPMPVLLYNIPGRTAVNLEPATVAELAASESNIVGIKESSGSLQQIVDLLGRVPRHFRVFAGDDYMALPALAAGGCGVISVLSNVAPAEVVSMVEHARSGDWVGAQQASHRLGELTAALFREPNPAPVKSLLHSLLRIGSDSLRLPLVPATQSLRDELVRLARALQLKPASLSNARANHAA